MFFSGIILTMEKLPLATVSF